MLHDDGPAVGNRPVQFTPSSYETHHPCYILTFILLCELSGGSQAPAPFSSARILLSVCKKLIMFSNFLVTQRASDLYGVLMTQFYYSCVAVRLSLLSYLTPFHFA